MVERENCDIGLVVEVEEKKPPAREIDNNLEHPNGNAKSTDRNVILTRTTDPDRQWNPHNNKKQTQPNTYTTTLDWVDRANQTENGQQKHAQTIELIARDYLHWIDFPAYKESYRHTETRRHKWMGQSFFGVS